MAREAASGLDGIKNGAVDRETTWEIDVKRPIRTEVSTGTRKRGGEGHEFSASISFKWQVTPLRPAGGAQNTEIAVTGLASTLVQFCEGDKLLARWRMDVGTETVPGTVFHIQVEGDAGASQFPESLDVPRFPSMVPTPATVIEFVLAEMFQDDWGETYNLATPYRVQWRDIQRGWHIPWLVEQRDHVMANQTSPILALKTKEADSWHFLRR